MVASQLVVSPAWVRVSLGVRQPVVFNFNYLLASNRRVVNAATFNTQLLISSMTAGLVCAAVKSRNTFYQHIYGGKNRMFRPAEKALLALTL